MDLMNLNIDLPIGSFNGGYVQTEEYKNQMQTFENQLFNIAKNAATSLESMQKWMHQGFEHVKSINNHVGHIDKRLVNVENEVKKMIDSTGFAIEKQLMSPIFSPVCWILDWMLYIGPDTLSKRKGSPIFKFFWPPGMEKNMENHVTVLSKKMCFQLALAHSERQAFQQKILVRKMSKVFNHNYFLMLTGSSEATEKATGFSSLLNALFAHEPLSRGQNLVLCIPTKNLIKCLKVRKNSGMNSLIASRVNFEEGQEQTKKGSKKRKKQKKRSIPKMVYSLQSKKEVIDNSLKYLGKNNRRYLNEIPSMRIPSLYDQKYEWGKPLKVCCLDEAFQFGVKAIRKEVFGVETEEKQPFHVGSNWDIIPIADDVLHPEGIEDSEITDSEEDEIVEEEGERPLKRLKTK